MENILVPVSPAELLDKITILEIKSERMNDPGKLANVRRELALLAETWVRSVREDETVFALRAQLKDVNQSLWEIEDDIRDKERNGEFDEEFIQLARNVYFTNDRRSSIKQKLNRHLGSHIVEEKSYQAY